MTEGDICVIKRAVRRRDGSTCVDCGMTDSDHRERFGRGIHVHRLEAGSEYSLDGCVTVCIPCHGKRHTGDNSTAALGRRRGHRQRTGRPGKVALAFYLRNDLHDALRAYCRDSNQTMTAVIKNAMIYFLDEQRILVASK